MSTQTNERIATVTSEQLAERIYTSSPDNYTWKNLYWHERALFRLGSTIAAFSPIPGDSKETREDKQRCLADLANRLDYLNQYGGNVENTNVPAYKIMLHDDGLFGSFSLLWYRAVTAERIHELAAAQDMSFCEYVKTHCLDGTYLSYYDTMPAYYVYAFNGGLIWHWSGSESGDPLKGSYGVHT